MRENNDREKEFERLHKNYAYLINTDRFRSLYKKTENQIDNAKKYDSISVLYI